MSRSKSVTVDSLFQMCEHPFPFQVLANQDFHTSSTQQGLTDKWKPEKGALFSLCDLQITEPDDKIGPPSKDACFSPPKS